MGGRMYTASFPPSAETAGIECFEILLNSTQLVIVHSIHIGQTSDAGDAEAGMLRAVIRRGVGNTSGGTGTAVVPRPHDVVQGTFGGTCEGANNSLAIPGGGSIVILDDEAFNIQAGWYHTPTPEERFIFNPSEAILISCVDGTEDFADATPTTFVSANTYSIVARVTFEVFGTL